LSPPVQERLRTWLAEHLSQIQKREWPFRNGVYLSVQMRPPVQYGVFPVRPQCIDSVLVCRSTL